MLTLEYWLRLIRLPIEVGLAIAGYYSLLEAVSGWQFTFMYIMLLLFLIATITLEVMQLARIIIEKRQSKTKSAN